MVMLQTFIRIRERGTFILFYKISVATIALLNDELNLSMTYQLGIINNIGDILQIGRFFSSGDNFVSDSGDCLFIGRTDFHPKKRNGDAHYSLYLRALQLSFSDGDPKKRGTNPRFLIGAPRICRAND